MREFFKQEFVISFHSNPENIRIVRLRKWVVVSGSLIASLVIYGYFAADRKLTRSSVTLPATKAEQLSAALIPKATGNSAAPQAVVAEAAKTSEPATFPKSNDAPPALVSQMEVPVCKEQASSQSEAPGSQDQKDLLISKPVYKYGKHGVGVKFRIHNLGTRFAKGHYWLNAYGKSVSGTEVTAAYPQKGNRGNLATFSARELSRKSLLLAPVETQFKSIDRIEIFVQLDHESKPRKFTF